MRNLLLSVAFATSVTAISVPDGPVRTASPVIKRQDQVTDRAIEPTDVNQIGINPVSIYGDPKTYQLTDLGPDNPHVTISGNEYHYIEGHTNYLTIETKTEDGQTKTSVVQATVQTATADGPDHKKDDKILTFPQSFGNKLRPESDRIAKACNWTPPVKKRDLSRRQSGDSCFIDEAIDLSEDDNLWQPEVEGEASNSGNFWQDEGFWEGLDIEVAPTADEVVSTALAAVESEAQRKKAMVIFAALMAGIETTGVIAVVNIPAQGVGSKDKSEGDDDETKKCDPEAAADQNSYPCPVDDCKGKDGKCTSGPDEGCACVEIVSKPNAVYRDEQLKDQKEWLDEQQKVLNQLSATPLVTAAPVACFANSDSPDFDGTERAEPKTWCVCTNSGKVGVYATMDNADKPCAHPALPSETITIKHSENPNPDKLECRVEHLKDDESKDYCTCNDNKMHGFTEISVSGSATKVCPGTTADATTAAPTAEVTCIKDSKAHVRKSEVDRYAEYFCDRKSQSWDILRSIPSNPLANGISLGYIDTTAQDWKCDATGVAYLHKDCKDKTDVKINKDDCKAAIKSIVEKCGTYGEDETLAGQASVGCQWYAVWPNCKDCGGVKPYYNEWPLGEIVK